MASREKSREASQQAKIKWLKEFNTKSEDPFKVTESGQFFCKACEDAFSWGRKSELVQHSKSQRHKKNLQLKAKRSHTQAQLEDLQPKQAKMSKSDRLGKELGEAFLAAGIPWLKLENLRLRGFLESNLGITIPSETTMRKRFLDDIYEESLTSIKNLLDGHPLWISVDETTDVKGRHVAIVLVGRLDNEKYHQPHVVNIAFMEKTNSDTIAQLINDTIRGLFPQFEADLLKLFLTDGAPYCLRAGQNLKVFYPELQRITCIAHGIHRVAEEVREMFPAVNELISSVKKIFKKAPSRVALWKECCPDLPLPPDPVITRQGSWIQTALYYASNLGGVCQIIKQLDSDEAEAIRHGQEIVRNASLEAELAFIKCHLYFILDNITKLERAGLPLTEGLRILDDTTNCLNSIPGQRGKQLQQKMRSVLEKNPSLSTFQSIASVLNGMDAELPAGMTPDSIANFKFCPVASVDVERTFSLYKNILSDRRQNLLPDSLKKIIVTQCFLNKEPE